MRKLSFIIIWGCLFNAATITAHAQSSIGIFFAFCYDDNKNELAEIDIENGALIWTGMKIPKYGYHSRGYLSNTRRIQNWRRYW